MRQDPQNIDSSESIKRLESFDEFTRVKWCSEFGQWFVVSQIVMNNDLSTKLQKNLIKSGFLAELTRFIVWVNSIDDLS